MSGTQAGLIRLRHPDVAGSQPIDTDVEPVQCTTDRRRTKRHLRAHDHNDAIVAVPPKMITIGRQCLNIDRTIDPGVQIALQPLDPCRQILNRLATKIFHTQTFVKGARELH